ncbi:ScyD/ScyE family protein [uncultured Sphingomonas sp.]|uniref:ScyD/ScyE family protein n=1 Tax=uncultured Sphingomonas sp. TaxID=158754 RepID=UPI0025CFD3C8|nr:ScyD/ScyE family protein [uncultured Sphingomonas sp.]
MHPSTLFRVMKAALLCGAMIVSAAPAAAAHYAASVFASDLNNPRGLAFGADGTLYVAETGYLDPSVPVEGGFRFMATGSITQVSGSGQSRIVTRLPSIFSTAMGNTSGAADIAFGADGTGYVVVGLGTNPANRPADSRLGHVLTFTNNGTVADFADVSGVEGRLNPIGLPDSNPFHLAATPTGLLVTDAGANTLNQVSASGGASIRAIFPPRFIGQPLPLSDSVPTGVTVGPDGTIYVAELTGFPFVPGAARIYSLAPRSDLPSLLATGLTNLTDLAFGPDGSLYALEYDVDGILGPGVGGAILRIMADGTSQTLFDTGLVNPTGLTIGSDGAFYVTVNSNGGQGAGEVWRIAPVPEPASWMLVISGFGLVGLALRSSRRREAGMDGIDIAVAA